MIILVILVVLFSVILRVSFGTHPYWMALVGNSMRPAYSRGDILLIKHIHFHELKNGDVVVYKAYGETIPPLIARIISINYKEETFTTKGDANRVPLLVEENVSAQKIMGKVVFSLPLLGYLDLYYVGTLLRIIFVYFLVCAINSLLPKEKR